jgi:hypothetical protein
MTGMLASIALHRLRKVATVFQFFQLGVCLNFRRKICTTIEAKQFAIKIFRHKIVFPFKWSLKLISTRGPRSE